jgi:hypothetical protein
MELVPLITGVSEQRLQERIHPEQGRKQQDAAVAILDVSGMNDGVEQQTVSGAPAPFGFWLDLRQEL